MGKIGGFRLYNILHLFVYIAAPKARHACTSMGTFTHNSYDDYGPKLVHLLVLYIHVIIYLLFMQPVV